MAKSRGVRECCMMASVLVHLLASALGLENGLGLTPVMAWSSWNYFGNGINETIVLETADALVQTGLRELGYVYVNIDAGAILRNRTAAGELQEDRAKFPRGMRWLADRLHAKKLKLGVYTDLSGHSCGTGPGSQGHYSRDAQTYAGWHADYLKVDFCGPTSGRTDPGEGRVSWRPAEQLEAWTALAGALNATGRPMYFAICPHTLAPDRGTAAEWHNQSFAPCSDTGVVYSPPREWSAADRAVANSILVEYTNTFDYWYSDSEIVQDHGGMLTGVDAAVQMTDLAYGRPGSWNDMDMLQVCMFGEGSTPHAAGGMTMSEYRSHLSVWAILASPLILGADVRTLGARHPECLELLLNPEIVAVNQDPAAHPPRLVAQATNSSARGVPPTTSNIVSQVFVRALGPRGANLAVVLFNRAEAPAALSVAWAQLGLPPSATYAVRDVIGRQDLLHATGELQLTVARHDVAFVVLRPTV